MKKVYLLYAFSRDLDAEDVLLGVYENHDDVVKATAEFKPLKERYTTYDLVRFRELDFYPTKSAE